MTGYIKLFRGWRDTDGLTASKCFSDWEAWLWLLENAAWKDRTRFNGKGEEIAIKRGQLQVSLAGLATAFGWSKKRVRTFLDRIENVSKVVTVKGTAGTIITICKYEEYQGADEPSGTPKGTIGAQSGHTHKERKEGKEERNRGMAALRPACVSEPVWADFQTLRRAKRAPLTATALAAIEREAQIAGWSLEAALAECVARGWQGFKAGWVAAANDHSEAEKYGEVW